MRRLGSKIYSILNGKSGETLMESIASIFVLAILLTAITMMIAAALRMTASSTADAAKSRGAANDVMAGVPEPVPGIVALDISGNTIIVDVEVYSKDGFTSYMPAIP